MGKKEVKMAGSMELKTAVSTALIQKRVFRWFISKYTILKPGNLYYQVFIWNGMKYVYMLLKAEGKFHIAFQCDYSNALGMFNLINGVAFTERLVEAIEISDGLYVGHFPESYILHKNSDYHRTELVSISFRFVTDSSTSEQYYPVGDIGPCLDFDDLCHDIQAGFMDSRGSDFTFKFSEVSIKAHKCVLYGRSNFFKEFFVKDQQAAEFSVSDIPPGIMFEVLLYMYSGELSDISADCIVKVLEVAYLFKITSLKERCLKYFEETDSWEAIEGVEFFEYNIED